MTKNIKKIIGILRDESNGLSEEEIYKLKEQYKNAMKEESKLIFDTKLRCIARMHVDLMIAEHLIPPIKDDAYYYAIAQEYESLKKRDGNDPRDFFSTRFLRYDDMDNWIEAKEAFCRKVKKMYDVYNPYRSGSATRIDVPVINTMKGLEDYKKIMKEHDIDVVNEDLIQIMSPELIHKLFGVKITDKQ